MKTSEYYKYYKKYKYYIYSCTESSGTKFKILTVHFNVRKFSGYVMHEISVKLQ